MMSSRDKLIPLAMTSLKRAGVVVEVDFFGEVSVFYEVDPAWRPLKHVQGAYQWLCNHYEAGAKISIVGFSRGAYTARVLSALICCLGILDAGMSECISKAWEAYVSTQGDMSHPLAQQFRRSSFVVSEINFVGLFDTVSEIGVEGLADRLTKNELTETLKYCKHVAHALAIDEKRHQFLPYRISEVGQSEVGIEGRTVEEFWFAGVHSDVGGGYVSDPKDPGDLLHDLGPGADRYPARAAHVPLRWMMLKALQAGVTFSHRAVFGDRLNIYLRPDLHISPHEVYMHLTHTSQSTALSQLMKKRYNIGLHQFSPFSLPEQRQAEVNAVIEYAAELDSMSHKELSSPDAPFGATAALTDCRTQLHSSYNYFYRLIGWRSGIREFLLSDRLHPSVYTRFCISPEHPTTGEGHRLSVTRRLQRWRYKSDDRIMTPYRPRVSGALKELERAWDAEKTDKSSE